MQRKPIFLVLFSILALAAVVATFCRRVNDTAPLQQPVAAQCATDTLYSPMHSKGFLITAEHGSSSSTITIFNPWQGAEGVSMDFFIARGGESAPEGFSGITLNGDAGRIIAMSSTYVAMLETFSEAGRVVGVSGLDFINSGAIDRTTIKDVGYDANIDFETIVSLKPDIVLLYGVATASNMESKLTGLGIPYLYIGEYLEQSPLGKAEWIVVLGELTGRRGAAEKAYLQIEARYNAVRDGIAKNTENRPKVMLNTPYADNWYMPSDSSYFVRLIEDAGGEYVYPGNSGNKSVTIDMEEAYLLARSADVWINVGQYTSIKHLLGDYPMFSDCGCVKDGNVWNCNLRTNRGGGNDFWESGAVRPDLVLQDLVQVFGTDTTNTPLTYYRRLE